MKPSLALACLALLWGAAGAQAAELTATPATLAGTLAKAAGGDHLTLAPGPWGDVVVRSVSPPAPVSISGPGAILRTLTVISSHGLHFDGLAINYTPDAKTVGWSAAVAISTSTDVSLTNSKVTGGMAIAGGNETDTVRPPSDCIIGRPCAYGINVQHSSGVQILANEVSLFDRGINAAYLTDGLIQGNDVHDTRRTPIMGAAPLRVVIDNNHLHDVHPWAWGQTPLGDHGDFIAFWIAADQTFDSAGLVISRNLMEQGGGVPVLGSWLQDSPTHTFIGPVYQDNTILNGNFQGITLRGVSGGLVTGNTLIQTSGGAKDAPSILLTGKTAGVDVHGNVTWQVSDVAKVSNVGANDNTAPGIQPAFVQAMARRLASH